MMSLTFMCTQNMQAIHIIKAIKPLSRMQYIRSISNQPKRNVIDILLIAWIFGGITGLCIHWITEFGPTVDVAEEIEKKYEKQRQDNLKNNKE